MMNGPSFGIWAARIPAVRVQTAWTKPAWASRFWAHRSARVLTMTFGGWLGSKFGTHVMTPLTLLVAPA